MSRVIDDAFLKKLEATKQKKLVPLLETTLREYAPKECKVMSKTNLEKFLNICYNNAQAHGTQNLGEVKAFTFLAFNLGTEFYKDPLYPKIVNIFESTSPIDVKLSRATNYFLKEHYLYTKEQLKQYLTALNKLEKVAFEAIPNPLSTEQMANYLKAAYPQRVNSLGGVENLQKLMPKYHQSLQAQQLGTALGHFVFYMVWMFLGSSFLNDPRYDWLRKEFYVYEKSSNSKSYRFLREILKRLRREKKVIERLLKSNEDIIATKSLVKIISSSDLDEASSIIVYKTEESWHEQQIEKVF
jgi:hypothetical protein